MYSSTESDSSLEYYIYNFEEITKSLNKNDDTLLMKTLDESSEEVRLTTSYENETLLHAVAKYNYIEAAKRLIDHGIDVNVEDDNGRTPLFISVPYEIEMVKFLLANGANVYISSKTGETIIQQVLLWGSTKTVQVILDKLIDGYVIPEDNSQDDARNCHKIVELLLNQRIDYLVLPKTKYSLLLQFVVNHGEKETFKLVLEDGKYLDVNALGPYNQPILHRVIEEKKSSVLNIVCGLTELRIKFFGKKIQDTLRYVGGFNCATDPNVSFNKKLIKFLTEEGADTSVLDKGDSLKRFSPLERAYQVRHMDIVQFLVNYSFDSRNKYFMQTTMLWDAVNEFDSETLDFLIQNGVNVNDRDKFGRAPLHYVIKARYGVDSCADFIEFLIDNGANVNIRTLEHRIPQKETALHLAVTQNLPEIVECLLALNADFTIIDFKGRWPLVTVLECLRHITYVNKHESLKILIAFMAMTKADIYNSSGCEILLERGGILANRIYQKCKMQVEIMKLKHFITTDNNSYISLYDLLKEDLTKIMTWPKISKNIEILEGTFYRDELPQYMFFLHKRIDRVKSILRLKNPITTSLSIHAKLTYELNLPVEIAEMIFSYMSIEIIRNFKRAMRC